MGFVGVHRFTKPGIGSVNTYWIEAEDGLVVIDGQRDLSSGRAAKAEVDALGKPIRAVFLTHPHPDHFGGIGVFASEKSGIPLYASAQTRESIRADRWGLVKASRALLGEEFPDAVRLPTDLVVDSQPIEVCGMTIVPAELGGGEAECMTALHLPAHELLFAADAVQDRMTAFLLEGRPAAWLGQLHALRIRFPNVKTLYPGHGDPGPAADLVARQIAYLETACNVAEASAQLEDAVRKMERLYPGYVPVAAIADLLSQDMTILRKQAFGEPSR